MREKQPPTRAASARGSRPSSSTASPPASSMGKTTARSTTTRSTTSRSPTTTTTASSRSSKMATPRSSPTSAAAATRRSPAASKTATTASSSPPRSAPTRASPKATSPATPKREDAVVVERMDGVKSEPRRTDADVLGPPPPPRLSSSMLMRRSMSNISTDSEEVRRLRTQLQGMKEQVFFMHKMMQGLSRPEKQSLSSTHPLPGEKARLAFSGISPVKKTRGSMDVLVMPDEENPFQDKWTMPMTVERRGSSLFGASAESSAKERDLASKVDALQLQNDSLKAQLQQQKQTFDASKAEYEAQIEDYTAKLAVIDAENLQLHAHVEEYEEENLRLHAALAEMENEQNLSLKSNNQGNATADEAAQDGEELADELGIDGLGEEPDDVHERCDAKIHELWQTIKTLKAYVETFRVENEDLRVQRDNAIASAERAWEENSKLAGNNNPQQKIKYVEILKQENAELIQKVRELQSKLTKKQFKRGDDGPRKDGKGSSASGSEPLEEYPSMESADDHSDDGSYEERTKLLKKMWARNKKLEEEIDRLRKEKHALVTRQSRSPSVDSRQSRQSSTRSTTRTASQSTTSSRWKK